MKHLSVKLLVVILVVSGLVQLVLANNLCTAGVQISSLEREKSQLSSEIASYTNELSQKTSLATISKKAKAIGLADSENSFDFLVTSVAMVANATP